MGRKILVSDLHIDTWTDRKIRETGKTKEEHFYDFLSWCEDAQIDEFIINGDILDLPPVDGEAFPANKPIVSAVITRLLDFATKVPVTYVYGNHDIGISGLQSQDGRQAAFLGNTLLYYPVYRFSPTPETTILVSHGHLADPFLALYVKSVLRNTYFLPDISRLTLALQRKRPDHPGPFPVVGTLPSINVASGENAYKAVLRQQQPLRSAKVKISLWDRIKNAFGCALAPATREVFWQNALDEMQQFIDDQHGKGGFRNLYLIYGHTHAADARVEHPLVYQGVVCRYLNSGTWTEGNAPGAEIVDQGWYVDIRENGTVWLQDWINESTEDKCLQLPAMPITG